MRTQILSLVLAAIFLTPLMQSCKSPQGDDGTDDGMTAKLFVAVSNGGFIVESTDGDTWTARI